MPRAKGYRARDYGLELRPVDNHTIRLLSSHLGLSLRETVHRLITHFITSHNIKLLSNLEHPDKILSDHKQSFDRELGPHEAHPEDTVLRRHFRCKG